MVLRLAYPHFSQRIFMKNSKVTLLLLLIICLSLFSSRYASAREQLLDACVASIRVPSDNHVKLAEAKYDKIHMTCPINVKKENTAKIYILHGKDICGRTKLFDYSVISHKLVTDAYARSMYDECSGVIHSSNKLPRPNHTTTYAWYAALPDQSDRERRMSTLFPKLTGRIISSGLPVLQFVSENNIFCFEMDGGYDKDPLAAVRTLGIEIPPWVRQIRYQNKSCNALFHTN